MHKGGQFFLIAALAIVGVLIGLASVYTSAITFPEDTTVYDLSNELGFEGAAVIDHGVFYSLSLQEKIDHLEIITDEYSRLQPATDFIVIYGNSTNLTVSSYTSEDTGSVGLSLGSQNVPLSLAQNRKNVASLNPNGQNKVTIIVDPTDKNIKHSFDLKPGETFFIIAKEEKQGERYVSTSI
jgi:hypothetical protein